MSGIVGESFVDCGNAPECVIDRIPAYEVLDSGLIRIFVCKTSNNLHILDHTDIMTRDMLFAIGARLIEIARVAPMAPELAGFVSSSRPH